MAGRRAGAGAVAHASEDPIDLPSLGRAFLTRQHLLAPREGSVVDEVAHLVGLQSQVPTTPYPGLWSRLAGFATADLGERLLDRSVVRIANLRGTIHLVGADDAFELQALMRPLFDAALRPTTAHGRALADVDHGDLARAADDLLATPLTSVDLGERLARRWPDVPPTELAFGARCLLPLVQVPPRGLWGARGAGTTTTWTTADAWLGRSAPPERPGHRFGDPADELAARVRLVRRYLAAFGPATVADAQKWSGLTRLKAAFDVLRPELVAFAGPDGSQYLDLPDVPRPGLAGGWGVSGASGAPDDSAAGAPSGPGAPDDGARLPLVLAAPFDNLVIGHADRSRVLSRERRDQVFTVNGLVAGTVLVDGQVVATWAVRRDGAAPDAPAFLDVTALGHVLDEESRAALDQRGAELLRFWAPEAVAAGVVVG